MNTLLNFQIPKKSKEYKGSANNLCAMLKHPLKNMQINIIELSITESLISMNNKIDGLNINDSCVLLVKTHNQGKEIEMAVTIIEIFNQFIRLQCDYIDQDNTQLLNTLLRPNQKLCV